MPFAKAPERLCISYHYSSSPLLQEQALPIHMWPYDWMKVPIMLQLLNTLMHLQYRSPWSAVRIGRLLEDLDSLAGNIAYEHW